MNELTKKILDALGVKPDEEFYIRDENSGDTTPFPVRYNTEKNYLEFYDDAMWYRYGLTLNALLQGKITIIHKPWKPKYDEEYYFIEENGRVNCFNNDNNYLDLMCWHTGNCFKTKEEAKANKDRIMKLYESDTPLWKKVEDKE